jgi:hypothetical protein
MDGVWQNGREALVSQSQEQGLYRFVFRDDKILFLGSRSEEQAPW